MRKSAPAIGAASLLLLLAIAAGCRSTASPTFAGAASVPPTEVAGHPGHAPTVPGLAAPAQSPRSGQGTIVQPGTGELQPARESPLAKLLGTFQKPRRIPLPRTDLPEAGSAEGGAAEPPATGLAEAF